MVNRAKEARARLEASFRKQHEAERTAAKDGAKHDSPGGRERNKPKASDGSPDQKGGRQGDWS
jgi:hypothetical protein